MARLPYAARSLVRQIMADHPKMEYEPHGDPDGLNVHRTIRFDKATSEALGAAITQMDDPRIEEASVTEAGYLHVTFVGKPIADQRGDFALEAAREVAAAEESEPEEKPKSKPRKRAAKKATPESPESRPDEP
jgi:hypothetical protein